MKRSGNRDAIVRAALAEASERGLDRVSSAALCRVAGVSNGTLFHFFPTREALAAELYLRSLEGYQQALLDGLARARSARAGVRGLVLGHLRWVLARPAEARILHEGRRAAGSALRAAIASHNQAFVAGVVAWLRPHTAARAVRRLPVDVLVAVLFGPIHTMTRDWLRGGDPDRLRRAAPLLADAAWAALAR